jgi:Arc/MetJ-type ribon-helix-helix transcriptional regulator
MKTITLRLPESLLKDIDEESRERRLSRSDVVRDRLRRGAERQSDAGSLDDIEDLIGSVAGLPSDLSERKKEYLRKRGYGRKSHR